MADEENILGTWNVSFQNWKWEYIFSAGGKVTWRDPSNAEHGSGRWSISPKVIALTWDGSRTKETWNRPIRPEGQPQPGWYVADYGVGPLMAVRPPRIGTTTVETIDPWQSWDIKEGSVEPMSASIPVAVGMAGNIRIPVPGTQGLAVELSPRGWTPKGGSTSTLFIQDITGKRHIRLDYGYNVQTKTIDYHWNRSAKPPLPGIKGKPNPHPFNNKALFDHANPKGGATMFKAAKYLKWGGRVLFVVGAAVDVYSIVQADKPLRRATQVVAGWAGAWAGCKVVGAGGAALGTVVEPGGGTAVGAFFGCVIGGAGGYFAGSEIAGVVYDWAEETIFTPLPEAVAP